jgi:DNA helicase-2/ATP-dependent DNA helicase PcrA
MQALDFDDLLLFTLRFLERKDSAQAERWRTRFKHVLVDEFQDTNAVQLALVKRFAESGLVTAVGDAAQSIYSWRGADHTVLDRFAAEFSPAAVVMLGENYRSTPQIVHTCQSILDADLEAPYRLELSTSNQPGAPVQARECDDDRDEANYIASRIEASSIPASEHAVLVRTAAQTRPIEDEFVSRRIPYVVVGGLRFYDRAEVRDALSYLRAASYPCDVVSFQRAVAAPKRGVGDKTVAEVAALALELGSLELALAGHTGRAAKALGEFAETLSLITTAAATPEASQSGPASAVKVVIDKALRAHWAKDQDVQGRMENLEQLQAAAESFTKGTTVDGQVVSELDGRSQLLAFLEHVALIAAVDEGKAECVQVMTMHAAKGREFPSVFVAGLEEEILPHVRSKSSHAELQEERRLFYVACSRAEKVLSITWCRSRFLFGKHRDQVPSRFLSDLPTDPEILLRTRAVNRKAPWTQNHRSRPVGTGAWTETSAQTRPLSQPTARTAQPADSPRVPASDATPGSLVSHASFGDGEILSVKGDSVTILFSGTKRTLSLQLAPMSLKK